MRQTVEEFAEELALDLSGESITTDLAISRIKKFIVDNPPAVDEVEFLKSARLLARHVEFTFKKKKGKATELPHNADELRQAADYVISTCFTLRHGQIKAELEEVEADYKLAKRLAKKYEHTKLVALLGDKMEDLECELVELEALFPALKEDKSKET